MLFYVRKRILNRIVFYMDQKALKKSGADFWRDGAKNGAVSGGAFLFRFISKNGCLKREDTQWCYARKHKFLVRR